MKKVIALFLLVNMILGGISNTAYAGEYRDKFYIEYGGQVYRYSSKLVSLVIDGKPVTTGEMPAIIIDSRTLVPVREVFESAAINGTVEWNGAKQEIYIAFKDKIIVLKIGSKIATVNGKDVELDVPANLIRDLSQDHSKTMVPLRFVTESLGYAVKWDSQTFTASITSPVATDGSLEDTSGEQLDGVTSDKAKRLLPTALIDHPIVWSGTGSSTATGGSTTIASQNNTEVNITSLDYFDKDGIRKFNIQASGPISSVDAFTLDDGRYVVDIHGAKYAIDSQNSTYSKTYSNNPLITTVRSSQQSVDSEGKKVVRVVFVLNNPISNYHLVISEDRKTLSFQMGDNIINGVSLGQNSMGDYIQLKGSSAPAVHAFRLSNPDRIVFDLPNSVTQLGYLAQEGITGQYVKSIRTAQFDPTTTRVVIETDGQADYTITTGDTQTTLIQLLEPSYDNINYQNDVQPTIVLENAQTIPIDQITYEDNYRIKQYIIHLPGNYENVFGVGGIQVDDSHINSIEIQKNATTGFTDLVINENDIYVFRIESDSTNVYLKAYKPKEIYSQILLLDFGHGGKDPGATGIGGVKEKDLNLTIGLMVKSYLDADPSIKVYYTRTADTFPELEDRTNLGNAVGADFFVSIHNNAFNSNYTGSETYYFKEQDRSGLTSFKLATIFHKYILAAFGQPDRGIRDNNSLFVLRNTNMPAILLEEGFVTNTEDIKKLIDPIYQEAIAQGIYNGIVETFATYPTGR